MTTDSAHPPTLLVVDDDRVIFDVIKRFATAGGFAAIYRPDGPEALECIAGHGADVAAVDLQMPQLFSLIERLAPHVRTASNQPDGRLEPVRVRTRHRDVEPARFQHPG